MPRSLLLRTAAILGACGLLAWVAAQSGSGSLEVEIRDAGTGRPVPAMVCITSLADGKWRTPPDGETVPPFTRVPDFYDPRDWKPGDIGPVRLTIGDYKNNQTRSSIYGEASAYPFWKEPAAYFVSRPFSIKLPAGRWRLAVERGVEYLPVFEEFEVRPGQNLRRIVRLERWVDMARTGWYSGDNHVHHPRTRPAHDEFLLTWARAEDVHVLSTLQQTLPSAVTFPQSFEKPRHREGDYVIASGAEDPSNGIDQQGHALSLNLSRAVLDRSRFNLYDITFDAARALGGITGYSHIAWAPEWYRKRDPSLRPTWDTTLNAIAGRIDFFEILQFGKLGLEDFYDFLSMGVRLAASAGGDVPWGGTVGEVRTYVYTGKEFNPDRWFAAMRKGNSFVTNGPMLLLTVNGAIPGEEVRVAPGAKVRVAVRAWAPEPIGAPQTLTIVAQGRELRRIDAPPGRTEVKTELTLPVEESQWVAARVESRNGAVAHTSPVYVLAGGRPVLDRARLPRLVEKRLAVLDYIEGRLKDARYTQRYAEGEVAAHMERVERARDQYRALLAPGR